MLNEYVLCLRVFSNTVKVLLSEIHRKWRLLVNQICHDIWAHSLTCQASSAVLHHPPFCTRATPKNGDVLLPSGPNEDLWRPIWRRKEGGVATQREHVQINWGEGEGCCLINASICSTLFNGISTCLWWWVEIPVSLVCGLTQCWITWLLLHLVSNREVWSMVLSQTFLILSEVPSSERLVHGSFPYQHCCFLELGQCMRTRRSIFMSLGPYMMLEDYQLYRMPIRKIKQGINL